MIRKISAWIILTVFCVVGMACLGCAKKKDDSLAGGKALQWKKSKEEELTGENADKGE